MIKLIVRIDHKSINPMSKHCWFRKLKDPIDTWKAVIFTPMQKPKSKPVYEESTLTDVYWKNKYK